MRKGLQRRSAIALAVSLICGVFLLETSFAHRAAPSPASPYVWTALGLGAAIALALSAYFRWKAKSAPE
jgi:Mg2+ and Co2+ transporter CorA